MRKALIGLLLGFSLLAQPPDELAEARKLFEDRRFSEAEVSCLDRIRQLTASGRFESFQTSLAQGLLARIYVLQGKVPQAVSLAEESLLRAERLVPPNDLRLDEPIDNLAFVHRWNGYTAQSRLLLERLLRMRENH
ncbi:MAG: hypothetical protein R2729_04775 [Bryobacteraceae bacterium]